MREDVIVHLLNHLQHWGIESVDELVSRCLRAAPTSPAATGSTKDLGRIPPSLPHSEKSSKKTRQVPAWCWCQCFCLRRAANVVSTLGVGVVQHRGQHRSDRLLLVSPPRAAVVAAFAAMQPRRRAQPPASAVVTLVAVVLSVSLSRSVWPQTRAQSKSATE